MKKKAGSVGLTLGIVFLLIGFASGNFGVQMLGWIILAMGLFFTFTQR